jgi:hypothetical protein
MPEDYSGLICDAPADWFPIPHMRELAVWRMLRRFRGPILGDESAVTNSLCLAVPLFDLILGDLSSNERHS